MDKRIDQPLSTAMLSIIRYLEEKYACSSVCDETVADFGFYRDINEPIITKSCGEDIKTLINLTLGILSLLLLATCFFLFLAFNAQYGLWRRRFSKDRKKAKDERSRNYLVEEAP